MAVDRLFCLRRLCDHLPKQVAGVLVSSNKDVNDLPPTAYDQPLSTQFIGLPALANGGENAADAFGASAATSN